VVAEATIDLRLQVLVWQKHKLILVATAALPPEHRRPVCDGTLACKFRAWRIVEGAQVDWPRNKQQLVADTAPLENGLRSIHGCRVLRHHSFVPPSATAIYEVSLLTVRFLGVGPTAQA